MGKDREDNVQHLPSVTDCRGLQSAEPIDTVFKLPVSFFGGIAAPVDGTEKRDFLIARTSEGPQLAPAAIGQPPARPCHPHGMGRPRSWRKGRASL